MNFDHILINRTSYVLLASLTLCCTSCDSEETASNQSPLPGESGVVHIEPAQPVHRMASTKVGINPFPYDITPNAVKRTANLVRSNGDLYTVQLDNGLPWQDALKGKPFNKKIQDEWQRHREWRASHQSLFLAIAPLQTDRKSWAGGYDGTRAPKWVRGQKQLTPEIKKAYIQYVMRAVEYFQPDFINIGVEAMDLAHNSPQAWQGMEELYIATKNTIKRDYRDVPVGMSIGLPLAMQAEVFAKLDKVIDHSDYFGISFYPHLKQFYDKIGGYKIPSSPPDQWRTPLHWAKQNIDLPIAICETGYSSHTVKVKRWGLDMPSNSQWQAQYVEDLAAIAARDNYLFVNFFLGIDYDALAERIDDPLHIMPLWKNSGFFDRNFNPKPAWEKYQKAWLNRDAVPAAAVSQQSNVTPSQAPRSVNPRSADNLGGMTFTHDKDLFKGPPSADITRTLGEQGQPAMKWSYGYQQGEWAWAKGNISVPVQNHANRLTFDIISDRTGPLFLQVIEKGGEAFYAELNPNPQWQPISVELANMPADPQKKQNGKLDITQIHSILLADGAAEKKSISGERAVYITAPIFRP